MCFTLRKNRRLIHNLVRTSNEKRKLLIYNINLDSRFHGNEDLEPESILDSCEADYSIHAWRILLIIALGLTKFVTGKLFYFVEYY